MARMRGMIATGDALIRRTWFMQALVGSAAALMLKATIEEVYAGEQVWAAIHAALGGWNVVTACRLIGIRHDMEDTRQMCRDHLAMHEAALEAER